MSTAWNNIGKLRGSIAVRIVTEEWFFEDRGSRKPHERQRYFASTSNIVPGACYLHFSASKWAKMLGERDRVKGRGWREPSSPWKFWKNEGNNFFSGCSRPDEIRAGTVSDGGAITKQRINGWKGRERRKRHCLLRDKIFGLKNVEIVRVSNLSWYSGRWLIWNSDRTITSRPVFPWDTFASKRETL